MKLRKKKVAVLQSNYIPWKGYFDIVHEVDLFIFYDDVQFTKNDWRNRNKIKTQHGVKWLTVPVGSPKERLINQIRPSHNHWPKKHWESIKQSYSKAPFFHLYQDFFFEVYNENKWTNLSELNQYLVKTISEDFLGINTEFKNSHQYSVSGTKLFRLIELLQKAGTKSYLSGPKAKDYVDEIIFMNAGIQLVYKDYSGYPEYPQLFPPFEHNVSIVDLLFNCGPDSSYYIWGWRD